MKASAVYLARLLLAKHLYSPSLFLTVAPFCHFGKSLMHVHVIYYEFIHASRCSVKVLKVLQMNLSFS